MRVLLNCSTGPALWHRFQVRQVRKALWGKKAKILIYYILEVNREQEKKNFKFKKGRTTQYGPKKLSHSARTERYKSQL